MKLLFFSQTILDEKVRGLAMEMFHVFSCRPLKNVQVLLSVEATQSITVDSTYCAFQHCI